MRVLQYDSSAEKFKVFGMATSCTINQTANTDDAAVKNDVGMASRPTVTSRSAQIQVEMLSVTDAAALLTAIKSLTPFTLIWDETDTSDNQTAEGADFARQCQAYLTDVTFNFNDRENCATSLQFTAISEPAALSDTPDVATVATGSYTKGQFVRLYLGSDGTATPAKVIAASKSLSLHVALQLESSSTKDTPGIFDVQEPTGLSFDISTNALVRSNDTITSGVGGQALSDLQSIFEAADPVKFQIANVSGDNNRTKGSVIVSGLVVISSLNISAAVKQNATYDASLTGYGPYTVGA